MEVVVHIPKTIFNDQVFELAMSQPVAAASLIENGEWQTYFISPATTVQVLPRVAPDRRPALRPLNLIRTPCLSLYKEPILETAVNRGLPCGRLSEPSREDAAHNHLINLFSRDTRFL